MKIFLFVASRKGYAVLKKLISAKAEIVGVLCLVEDSHEEQYHLKITELAEENQLSIFYSNAVKSTDYKKLLEEIQPDIAFAIGWRYLIIQDAYQIPKMGTLIIHDSLLPKYRGFAPLNWAIINGEKKTGVTLFHIAEGVDCGPIVDQLSLDIDSKDTAKTLEEKLIKLYEEIIIKNLPALSSGKVNATPQNDLDATYTCKRTPDDGLIDWHQDATRIYNLIRACTHPFPGAFTFLNRKKILVWSAELPEKQLNYTGSVAGRVLGKRNGKIEVLTGKGTILLSSLQYENESETEKSAAEFTVSVKDTFGR